MVSRYRLLAQAAFWGFGQGKSRKRGLYTEGRLNAIFAYTAMPTPQTPLSDSQDSQIAASPVVSGGFSVSSGLSMQSTPVGMLWYKNTHRDEFALYPSDKRDATGWQELSAAANSLMILYPAFLPQAIFGAEPQNFSPGNFGSTFEDGLAWDTALSAVTATSPAIRETTINTPTNGPLTQTGLDMTLFPLSPEPFKIWVPLKINHDNLGDSGVA
ncbi:hypothetical protein QFC24_006131 [Naganishia onofrii]|uniref:Uncharacterized protein n=1 Tax=Naganishia onofrii TaxID=1851511 RepID=A0ACC2X3Y6_9TREE|nr:hypothetical protein QFC24_006131 [Naganishia onofrii]